MRQQASALCITVQNKPYTTKHRDGVFHLTRADSVADKEHFDGKTTE